MLAFALSGGGNRGALQVGALHALLEAEIQPQMVVGASVGSVNALYFAARPTAAGVQEMAALWRKVTLEDAYPGGNRVALWNLLRGRASLFPNDSWRQFLYDNLPFRYFGDLSRPCYVIATNLDTGQPHIFGHDPHESVIDAIMASTALPPYHPPWSVNGRRFVDGGAISMLPVNYAVELGATAVVALNLAQQIRPDPTIRSALSIVNRTISVMIEQNTLAAMNNVTLSQQAALYNIDLKPATPLDMMDFSRSGELIAEGHRTTAVQLTDQPVPTAIKKAASRTAETADYLAPVRRRWQTVRSWWQKRLPPLTSLTTPSSPSQTESTA